ncbi:b(0,+)-type amino acid transporter 1-like isoform X3 [Artemia franciscana]|uniref:b(0,+)-type amino acid transporter 1-like isoform X3 n=1 Tax=Artemia franciscana TaxID=6661 RepID=UPI0032DA1E3F
MVGRNGIGSGVDIGQELYISCSVFSDCRHVVYSRSKLVSRGSCQNFFLRIIEVFDSSIDYFQDFSCLVYEREQSLPEMVQNGFFYHNEKSNGGVTVPGITAENAQGGEEDLGNSKRSGIFVSPSGLLYRSESVATCLIIWGACGALSMLGALSYAELGTMITQSGAEYSYFLEAFGPMPAFLFCWVSTFLLKPSQLAIISLSFAKYTVEPFIVGCEPPDLVVKLVCAATIGALCYCELGTLVPKSGAEYIYLLEAFKPRPKKDNLTFGGKLKDFFGPLPSFLFAWVTVLLLKPSSYAILTLSFSTYTLSPIFTYVGACAVDEEHKFLESIARKLLAAACIASITFINCYSVSLATKVQNIFTAAKLIAIFIIICGGIYMIALGNVSYLSTGFEPFDPSLSPTTFSDIATAFYSGLWAYDGWNNLNYVTEELKNPFVNLPRAIIIGLPLVTGCYILVNVAYLAVLSPIEMINSPAVAVTFGARALASWAWLMPLAVCVSTFGSANGTLFVGGRLSYVASREGHLVDILSYVHVRRLTPSPALLFNTLIALLMIIPGNIGSLIDFFSFTAWIFYGGCMAALILMRYTRPNAPRPYKVPIIMPIIVLIVSVYLVVAPIVEDPQIEYLYATMFILAGLIFYIPFIYYKVPVKCMGPVTAFLQYLLEVVPTKYE